MSERWKQVAAGGGCLLALAGLLVAPAGIAWLVALFEPPFGRNVGVAWLTLMAITWGGGFLLIYHAYRSQQKKASRPLNLPPLWLLGGSFLLALVVGQAVWADAAGGMFFPPLFLLAAGLPPLAAAAWAVGATAGRLTWRQFTVAFIGGATVGVAVALFLEVAAAGVILALVADLFALIQDSWDALVEALAGGDVASVVASPGFLLALVELAIIAPLAEEFAKPLAILPLIRHAPEPRHAFLLGAAAGAGFAALENVLYTGFGVNVWGGIVVLRALGAAVHPLATGLVALGWYEIFHPAGREHPWLSRFGLAAGVHALWNGGIVLFLALAGSNFFGPSPAEVDVLGYTLAGVLLALLAVMGAAAWFGLRPAGRSLEEAPEGIGSTAAGATERALAIWAVICLVAILPLGLAALRLLGGGS